MEGRRKQSLRVGRLSLKQGVAGTPGSALEIIPVHELGKFLSFSFDWTDDHGQAHGDNNQLLPPPHPGDHCLPGAPSPRLRPPRPKAALPATSVKCPRLEYPAPCVPHPGPSHLSDTPALGLHPVVIHTHNDELRDITDGKHLDMIPDSAAPSETYFKALGDAVPLPGPT